jgi:hypothetical protein
VIAVTAGIGALVAVVVGALALVESDLIAVAVGAIVLVGAELVALIALIA